MSEQRRAGWTEADVLVGGAYRDTARDQPREITATTQPWWQTEGLALAILAIVTAIAIGQIVFGGTLIGQDSATQFYPWYDYLGERLRAGQIPGWNPFQFSGAPFAADPQSGWMYLPAMVVFTLLSLSAAVPTFLILHLALAGGATYALARLMRLGVSGALVAAIAYELSGPVYGRSVCCTAGFEVASWAPVALVGAELAIQRRDLAGRFAGWLIAGFALSQALAAWLGQGAYYVLLMLAAFIAFRTLVSPPDFATAWRDRVLAALLHGSVMLTVGFGLAAASVLPRLDYIERTNVAGGSYAGASDWAAKIGGVTPSMLLDRILDPTLHYPGAAAGALAIIALVLARDWFATRFFVAFGVVAMLLAMPFETPLHRLLYIVLPRFETLHQHWPERIAVVAYITAAMLAGATIDALERRYPRRRTLIVAAVIPLVIVGGQTLFGVGLPIAALASVIIVALVVGLSAVPRLTIIRSAAAPVILLVVAADLLLGFHGVAGQAPYGGFHRVDIQNYFSTTGAVHFLRRNTIGDPARYIGFDPREQVTADGQVVLYRYQFADQETASLLVNNRATLHGLDDIQGYNPVQPERYVELMTALNGAPQEYHDANVYPGGLDSPLLDLLNVRYIIIPTASADARPDLAALAGRYEAVYEDRKVTILENPGALPRAWVVHETRTVAPGETLALLADGSIDPRQVALLESTPPFVEPIRGADDVRLVEQGPDALRFQTTTGAAGLLVVSSGYDPGWRAWIDGRSVDVLPADHALQAVPLPVGEHTVELRYETPMLGVGLLITGGTIVAVLLAGLAIWWSGIRRPSRG